MTRNLFFGCILFVLACAEGQAQPAPTWSKLPPLPDSLGWAGMYAGQSQGILFSFGGANFPAGYPWAGGQKRWYNRIYRLEPGKTWVRCSQTLPAPAGYGVSVSWKNQIILVGGSSQNSHLSRVIGYEWNGTALLPKTYPDLPVPLALMAGALVGNLIIVAGGSQSPAGAALNVCYGLDLTRLQQGWFTIDPWPGPARTLPVCGVYEDRFYLFGGEKPGISVAGKPFRHLLQDAYRLTLSAKQGKWTGSWQPLSPMPRGAAAAGSPLPLLPTNRFLVWGGVDAVTALWSTPATHPGITRNYLFYDPRTDTWVLGGEQADYPARVTLPVVFWQQQWVYVSGEIKPGIRTNTVLSVH